jgi:hypothetical protein
MKNIWSQGMLSCLDVHSGCLRAWRLRPCSRSYITDFQAAYELCRQSLWIDIKTYGSQPTPNQALQLDARWKAIMTCLEAHCANTTNYYLIPTVEDLIQETCQVNGEPKCMSTLIPSNHSSISTLSQLHENAVHTECELRCTSCLKALQTVCSLSIQQAQVTWTQLWQPCGQRTIMCSQSLLDRYRQRIADARWQYENSRKSLLKLGASHQDVRTFKELHDEDMHQLSAVLCQGCDLGQGRVTLPWYWWVLLLQSNNDTDTLAVAETDITMEHEESESLSTILHSLTVRYH